MFLVIFQPFHQTRTLNRSDLLPCAIVGWIGPYVVGSSTSHPFKLILLRAKGLRGTNLYMKHEHVVDALLHIIEKKKK